MTGTMGADGKVVLGAIIPGGGTSAPGPPPQLPDDPRIWQVRFGGEGY